MTTRKIAGIEFRAHSPSLFEYHGAWIAYDGRRWRVGVESEPWGTRRFPSAHAAALLIRDAFQQARENYHV